MEQIKNMISDISPDWQPETAKNAKALCKVFIDTPRERRYLFGRNVYADAVARKVAVAGFVDDFTNETESGGLPIFRLSGLPADAVVLTCSGGRPLTVRRILDAKGLTHLDYFSLLKWGGLDLPEAVFNEGFTEAVSAHKSEVNWVESLMADDTSLQVLRKLVAFRMSYDLNHLEGFTQREDKQYFEPFIDYSAGLPIFVDVGCFDGFTTEEFIKHVPDYSAVHVFEPDLENYKVCKARLEQYGNITLHPYGTGAKDEVLRFSSSGSASAISDKGDLEIDIRRIDDLVTDVPTFIKMDIEGAELDALEGARRLISTHHPTLAICVYHRPSDLWEVPQKVLSMYDGYSVYLRHYTESIYETVMYFVADNMVAQ